MVIHCSRLFQPSRNKRKIMVQMNTLMILLVSSFVVLGSNIIAGSKLSAEEDKILETQLKQLNKPAVTTIQTKNGESYDCVDFYEQPAFDHPLLRDHKHEYEMTHSYDQQKDKRGIGRFDIWLNGKGCPVNTVPIKRVTKEDLIKVNMATELVHTNSLNENPGVQVAVLRTTEQKTYYGAAMMTSVYHPAVQSMQYSSSRIVVQNDVDSISVGWTVNPNLYPDNETRLFIYTNTKDSHCYNTYCPGFVITTSKLPLDLLLKPYTVIGGDLYETAFSIHKDPVNGYWFLVLSEDDTTLGYWPPKIFIGLADSANYIEWGGEVYSPPGTNPPPIGSGLLPSSNLYNDCFSWKVSLIDENHDVDNNPASCNPYRTSAVYNIIDAGYTPPKLERNIFYGGHS